MRPRSLDLAKHQPITTVVTIYRPGCTCTWVSPTTTTSEETAQRLFEQHRERHV